MAEPLSPTIQRLRCFPKDNKRRNYPKGSRQPLTKDLAQRFCDLISTSLVSTAILLADNPGFPPFKTLESWRFRYPWFAEMWNQARKRQADFLVQHCFDLALNACPKTAHVVRVKFDIYKFIAAKFNPDLYGDKSQHVPQQTTVNVGISISPERLTEIRSKLDNTRLSLVNHASTSHDESRTLRNGKRNTQHEHANADHDQATEPGPAP